jgi:hypothetical protein
LRYPVQRQQLFQPKRSLPLRKFFRIPNAVLKGAQLEITDYEDTFVA